jgi:putative oxidoreductase
MSPIDWSLLIVRLVVGSTIVAHGVNHARSLESTARWFRRVGFRAARLQAALSAVVEMVAGVGLILGALTTIAAGAIIGVMTVAIGAIHRFNGFFIFRPG